MQAVKTFEKVSKRTINYKIHNRRSGDTAINCRCINGRKIFKTGKPKGGLMKCVLVLGIGKRQIQMVMI